jgi:hypothetical protein
MVMMYCMFVLGLPFQNARKANLRKCRGSGYDTGGLIDPRGQHVQRKEQRKEPEGTAIPEEKEKKGKRGEFFRRSD